MTGLLPNKIHLLLLVRFPKLNTLTHSLTIAFFLGFNFLLFSLSFDHRCSIARTTFGKGEG